MTDQQFDKTAFRLKAACAIFLLFNAQHLHSASATTALSTERLVQGFNAMNTTIEYGSDLYKTHEKTREKAKMKAEAISINLAKATYESKLANNGFQMKAYQGFALVRDGALALGGPVGIATAGTFRVTLDRMFISQIESQNEAASKLMHTTIRGMSDAEFKKFKENPSVQKEEIKKFASSALQNEDMPDADREKMANLITEMGLNLGVETYDKLHSMGGDIDDIKNASKQLISDVAKLNKANKAMHNQTMEALEDIRVGMVEAKYAQMSPEEQIDFIKSGGMDHLDKKDRDRIEKKANYEAGINTINRGFDRASQAMSGLENVARHLFHDEQAAKAFGDANTAIQAGQLAFSAFTAFSTGGVGFIAGVQSLGAMGALFGGGGNPMDQLAPQLQMIQEQLAAINERLDTVIALQEQTLLEVRQLSTDVNAIKTSLSELGLQLEAGNDQMLKTAWSQYFGNCSSIASLKALAVKKPNGSVGPADFGQLTDQQWQSFHFIDNARLSIYKNAEAAACFSGLKNIVNLPSVFSFFLENADGDKISSLASQNKKFLEQLNWLRSYSQEKGIVNTENGGGTSDLLIQLALLSRPPIALEDTIRFAGMKKSDLQEPTLPCWWRGTSTKDCSKWGTGYSFEDRRKILMTRRIHPAEVLRFADFVLSLYPLPLYPSAPQNEQLTSEWVMAHALDNATKSNVDSVVLLLERSIYLVDIAIIQQSIYEGLPLAGDLADELLNPAQSIDKKYCSAIEPDALRSADPYINIELKSRLNENPALARLAIYAALYKRAFEISPAESALDKSVKYSAYAPNAMEYTALLTGAPLDWTRNSFVQPEGAIDINAGAGGDALANQWWSAFANTEITIKENEPKVKRPNALQFVYVTDPSKPITVRSMRHENLGSSHLLQQGQCADPSNSGFFFTPESIKVQVRDPGWYAVVGITFVPLVSPSELLRGPLPVSTVLQKLLTKRDALVAERWSFEDEVDPVLRDAFNYGLHSMAIESKKEFINAFQ